MSYRTPPTVHSLFTIAKMHKPRPLARFAVLSGVKTGVKTPLHAYYSSIALYSSGCILFTVSAQHLPIIKQNKDSLQLFRDWRTSLHLLFLRQTIDKPRVSAFIHCLHDYSLADLSVSGGLLTIKRSARGCRGIQPERRFSSGRPSEGSGFRSRGWQKRRVPLTKYRYIYSMHNFLILGSLGNLGHVHKAEGRELSWYGWFGCECGKSVVGDCGASAANGDQTVLCMIQMFVKVGIVLPAAFL